MREEGGGGLRGGKGTEDVGCDEEEDGAPGRGSDCSRSGYVFVVGDGHVLGRGFSRAGAHGLFVRSLLADDGWVGGSDRGGGFAALPESVGVFGVFVAGVGAGDLGIVEVFFEGDAGVVEFLGVVVRYCVLWFAESLGGWLPRVSAIQSQCA